MGTSVAEGGRLSTEKGAMDAARRSLDDTPNLAPPDTRHQTGPGGHLFGIRHQFTIRPQGQRIASLQNPLWSERLYHFPQGFEVLLMGIQGAFPALASRFQTASSWS